jgi:chromatin segregation and condensation protein Rec8/ScpA/Scc1 (kleisin family)
MLLIIDLLEKTDSMKFEEFFKDDRTRPQVLVTFLAMLELLRLGLARVYQEAEFGQIWLIGVKTEGAQETIEAEPIKEAEGVS